MVKQRSEKEKKKKVQKLLSEKFDFEYDEPDGKVKDTLDKKIKDEIDKYREETKRIDGSIKTIYRQDTYIKVAEDKGINSYIRKGIKTGKIPWKEKELISITDMINEIGVNYGVDIKKGDDYESNIRRWIQRYLEDKPDEKANPGTKTRGYKEKFFSRDVVNGMFGSEEFQKYIKKQLRKNQAYKSNMELLESRIKAFNDAQEEMYNLWFSVGLTREEGNYLEYDKLTEKKYLRADELKLLKRKGMQLRAELPEEEREKLEQYARFLLENENEEKEIERLFKEKKLEIMISALFNERYSLDEEKLRNDIENYVRSDGIDTIVIYEEQEKNKTYPAQSFPVKRSVDNLKNNNHYVKKKRITPRKAKENTKAGEEPQ